MATASGVATACFKDSPLRAGSLQRGIRRRRPSSDWLWASPLLLISPRCFL